MNQATVRAFLALDPDLATREFLRMQMAYLQRASWARDVRWDDERKLHLTLRFLGDVTQVQINQLIMLLNASPLPALSSLNVTEARLFPDVNRPVAIACPVHRDESLMKLVRACERAALQIGCAAERRTYRGHITLGRVSKSWRRGTKITNAPQSALVRPSPLTLYQSTLTPHGSIYKVLARFEPMRSAP